MNISTIPLKRSRIISKYKNLLEENLENIAQLVSEEHGKSKLHENDWFG